MWHDRHVYQATLKINFLKHFYKTLLSRLSFSCLCFCIPGLLRYTVRYVYNDYMVCL